MDSKTWTSAVRMMAVAGGLAAAVPALATPPPSEVGIQDNSRENAGIVQCNGRSKTGLIQCNGKSKVGIVQCDGKPVFKTAPAKTVVKAKGPPTPVQSHPAQDGPRS